MSRPDDLYARYLTRLIADLVRFGQSTEDAQDIAQEAMIGTWKHLGSKVLWRAHDVQPIDDTFAITIPGNFLEPDTYTLNVYAKSKLVDS